MIVAIEAVINYLRADATLADLVNGQIADRHQFGDGWPIPSNALVLRPDGGPADIYLTRQELRVDARCYGEDLYEALRVYGRLLELCRAAERDEVSTQQGKALLYWLVHDSGPGALVDPETGVDVVVTFLRADISELSV